MIAITPQLFEAYLKCPTKSFLLSLGETGSGNAFAEWIRSQDTLYRCEGLRQLKEQVADNQCFTGLIDRASLTSRKWQPNWGAVADSTVFGTKSDDLQLGC